ncbi:MAG: lipoyl synthase [bacterium]
MSQIPLAKVVASVGVDPQNVVDHRSPKPSWLKIRLATTPTFGEVAGTLRHLNLNTVCQEARCPNINECWNRGTATFMILGDVCTRGCRFCNVKTGKPLPVDPEEPRRVAQAAYKMGLRWVVVTSVDRDDLPDGGASQFTQVVKEIRKVLPETGVEILTPDFRDKPQAVDIIMENPPDVFSHNVETVPRLYRRVRPGADYQRSLNLLSQFARREIIAKSGIMLGLGETLPEVIQVLHDLREAGVRSLAIGQYLRPTPAHWPVVRYVPPEEFQTLKEYALSMGFVHIAAGPLVRSSYLAEEAVQHFPILKKVGVDR